MTKSMKYMYAALLFTAAAVLPQLAYEYNIWPETIPTLRDAILWTLYVTLPAGILAVGSIILALIHFTRQKHR